MLCVCTFFPFLEVEINLKNKLASYKEANLMYPSEKKHTLKYYI